MHTYTEKQIKYIFNFIETYRWIYYIYLFIIYTEMKVQNRIHALAYTEN